MRDSADYLGQIDELIRSAAGMEDGPTRTVITEEAVRLADEHRDKDAGFEARKALTRAATFGGRPDLALVSFSWCLSRADEDEDRFPEHELLWQYKWILGTAPDFPNISRKQIDDLFADMAVRYRKYGSTLHALHQIKRDVAVQMHDPAAAEQAHYELSRLRRDDLSNCRACVQEAEIDYHAYFGRDEAALEASRVIFDGKLSCAEVPHRTHALVLLPLLRLGKLERAVRHYRTGYRMIRPNPKFIRHKSYHLLFLTLTDNLDRAARLFERHLGEAFESPSGYWRFEFYLAARVFLARLARGRAQPILAVPDGVLAAAGSGRPADLAGWLDRELAQLAAAFDARNGNDGHARRVGELPDLLALAKPYKIDGGG